MPHPLSQSLPHAPSAERARPLARRIGYLVGTLCAALLYAACGGSAAEPGGDGATATTGYAVGDGSLATRPLAERIAAMNDYVRAHALAEEHPLTDDIIVTKAFAMYGDDNIAVLRYRVMLPKRLKPEAQKLRAVYDAERPAVVAALTRDSLLPPLVREADAFYVDVYDQYEAYMFAYDVAKAEVLGE